MKRTISRPIYAPLLYRRQLLKSWVELL
jgi:hypothetical protein